MRLQIKVYIRKYINFRNINNNNNDKNNNDKNEDMMIIGK